MKKFYSIILLSIVLPICSFAQSVEVTPYAGYDLGGTLNAVNGDVTFKSNATYGGIISIAANRVMDIDLIYNRIDTKAELHTYNNYIGIYESPLSINYMHLGFTKNFRVNPKVSPFVGINFGASLFYPKVNADGTQYPDSWFFSMGMNAGAKVYFSDRIGLRLQAQMYVPYQGGGYTMYFGPAGATSGVSFYSTFVQFGFTGGLIFRLGKVLY